MKAAPARKPAVQKEVGREEEVDCSDEEVQSDQVGTTAITFFPPAVVRSPSQSVALSFKTASLESRKFTAPACLQVTQRHADWLDEGEKKFSGL